LFIGLWTEADDEGKLIDNAKLLAGSIFPHDDQISPRIVDKWLQSLTDVGSILRYEVDGARYIQVSEWGHQKISHPSTSRIPNPSGKPPETNRKISGDSPDILVPDLGSRIIGSRKGITTVRRAIQIPDDFVVTTEMRTWAAEKAPTINVDVETEQMIDYYRGKGEPRKDWVATWRTWMRNAVKFQRNRPRTDEPYRERFV
jgi:hypothetical protein